MELDDVQGLVRFGYRHLTEACYLLLRVKDPAAARAWLAEAPITSAVRADPLPQTALHVAFTSEGLRALEVAADLCAEFSAEFVAGMASDAARARRLGDVGANDPGNWRWGAGERVPHIDGLPVVQVQVQNGERDSRPVMVVAQQLSSGQVIRTIEGPATDVSQMLSRRAMADVDTLFLPGGDSANHAMAMQRGDRMLAITGDLPSDSLRAMIRRLNAEMRSK